ncbi:hypothetical protein F4782DRAFT_361418 [Xylaria castorea]|nr:hypothetical protein F4782DRAFT_361418 [Xylaria castorea]
MFASDEIATKGRNPTYKAIQQPVMKLSVAYCLSNSTTSISTHHLSSISGLVVKSIVAIDGPRVRFTADAFFLVLLRITVLLQGIRGGAHTRVTCVCVQKLKVAICVCKTRS